MIDKIPELRDEVANKKNDTVGTVITVYNNLTDGKRYLDVRSFDDHIYYNTPAENWNVTKVCDE